MGHSVRVIVNPHAGGGRTLEKLPAIQSAIEAHWELVEISVTQNTDDVYDVFHQIGANPPDCLLLVGGDGTNHVILNALMSLQKVYPDLLATPIGIIPVGTGQDWARMLNIPKNPVEAVHWLAQHQAKPIDIGSVTLDGKPLYFFNIASVGLGFEVADWVNRNKRAILPYVQATLRVTFGYRPVVKQIKIDGTTMYNAGAYLVVIANGTTFAGGMRVVPHAEIHDGLLDLMILGGEHPFTVLQALARVFIGQHLTMRAVQVSSGQTVTIVCDQEVGLEIEGQTYRGQTMIFQILPHYLRLLC